MRKGSTREDRFAQALGTKAGVLFLGKELNPFPKDTRQNYLWEQARKAALFAAADKRWNK